MGVNLTGSARQLDGKILPTGIVTSKDHGDFGAHTRA